jgi:hypothetical protein
MRLLLFSLAMILAFSPSAYAGKNDYKGKSISQLHAMCLDTNDAFACFLAGGKYKDAGDIKNRIEMLEHGAGIRHGKIKAATCMYELMTAFSDGDGVLQDYEQGYKWANLLSLYPSTHILGNVARDYRSKLSQLLSPEQAEKAQTASKKWLEEHPWWPNK